MVVGKKFILYWLSVGLVFIFSIGCLNLGYKAFFAPKHAAIDRQVFEQTQSYVHGKIQDLAKYKREFNESKDPAARKAIQNIINQQFAQFDSNKVIDINLKQFLIQCRGF